MILDFLIELFSDFSPMYFYLSVLLSVLCAFQFISVVANQLYRDTPIDIHGIKRSKVQLKINQNATNEIITRRNWRAIVTKRIELPDEEEDATKSSTNLLRLTLQGGLLCKKNLYSLSLRKQISSEYLSY
ncbi:hypothetical protein [Ornithinibacillus bavariensis]|uniref:Uncharacterized protein n=1 Tax=Ornithinibacillus bavariensis TaxID=545502 RepID=A0A919X8A4_9BACI|nr:hypothetical protein [Ornithinibacillus bavariensis]GIO27846.1 hypothetical protein J43TS3_24570 [Ornithinibacillus bavariensis]